MKCPKCGSALYIKVVLKNMRTKEIVTTFYQCEWCGYEKFCKDEKLKDGEG